MKKFTPYILGFIALAALVVLILGTPANKQRRLDERITLRQKDKIPYGTFAAKYLMSYLFPKATIIADKRPPGSWDSIETDKPQQAAFLIAQYFDPEDYELKRIAEFTQEGNYVFILASGLNYDATNFFKIVYDTRPLSEFKDSLKINLKHPPFANNASFVYPGWQQDSYFSEYDTATTIPLGTDIFGHVNFIAINTGRGKIFIHLAPLSFSNYFILHHNNRAYLQKIASLIPPDVHAVLWNEYFLTKRRSNDPQPSILRILWQYPPFRWGLVTAVVTLLLYVLLEMRRRQRMIPDWKKPTNDSLEFVRTMGRLYYDKGDHKNLAKKMANYFLDHVRMRYKISTQQLNDTFIQALHQKSNYPVHELQRLTSSISHINENDTVSTYDLSHLYKQLESFYQNT